MCVLYVCSFVVSVCVLCVFSCVRTALHGGDGAVLAGGVAGGVDSERSIQERLAALGALADAERVSTAYTQHKHTGPIPQSPSTRAARTVR